MLSNRRSGPGRMCGYGSPGRLPWSTGDFRAVSIVVPSPGAPRPVVTNIIGWHQHPVTNVSMDLVRQVFEDSVFGTLQIT